MIKVLQNWTEIGRAVRFLEERDLPLHGQPQRNWDHALLLRLLEGVDRSGAIVDLGCGPGHSLALLHRVGFRDLTGIDARLTPEAGPTLARTAWRTRRLALPWRLRRRDVCATGLPAASADAICSIAVVESGVPLPSLAAECARILKPGGLLFLTTDYWDGSAGRGEPAPQPGWRPFTAASVRGLLETFRAAGFEPLEPLEPGAGAVPPCGEPIIHGHGSDYTFVAIALRRRAK